MRCSIRPAGAAIFCRSGSKEPLFGRHPFRRLCGLGESDLYSRLLLALAHVGSYWEVKRIHGRMVIGNFMSKSVLVCRLIDRCFAFGENGDADKLFEQLWRRSLYCYNYMMKGYMDRKMYAECFRLCQKMVSEGILLDAHCSSLVLTACVGLKDIGQGEAIHGHVIQRGFVSDCFLVTALVDLYSKCGQVGDARLLFDEMPLRDVFMWTVMIDGYLANGMYKEALSLLSGMEAAGIDANIVTWNILIGGFIRGGLILDAMHHFRQMQTAGIIPDKVSMCLVLSGCAHSAMLKLGRESHAFVLRKGLKVDQFLASALVDMYAKCGNLDMAYYLFDQAEVKDVGLWNAIFAGYGAHGKCKEALELFGRMQDSKIRPNQITFASLISACSHAGMVNEGCKCFNIMIYNYKIIPRMVHYVCMVDMLGRAGHLEEAHRFINDMPIEPSKDVWGALLGACRVHQNVELAKVVAHQIFSCEDVDDAGYHVMMSNIYAETGKWEEMGKLRTQIRDERLRKKTAYSSIELENRIHTFYMGDTTHPKSDQIYAVLRSS
ncbi:putative pentatricopeptide repeat-containing protein [Nymphaea thermarum]|nr:putative pentatricopeptide repeat-containing protein [Nymphaea thermarum]